MFPLNKTSLDRLDTCHPDLKKIFIKVTEYFNFTVACGHRNKEDQDRAVKEGKSQIKWPNGNHNKSPSMAVDAYPCPVNLQQKTKKEEEIYKWLMSYFAGQVMAIARELKEKGEITHELRWGCDWDGDNNIAEHSFFDFPHFELVS
jgi:peptidoglycan L-alanyl-D-glutamate endopeptidase CwlK